MNTSATNEAEDGRIVAPIDHPIPCHPRALTRVELKRRDVYAFLSAKLHREVWLTGVLSFAACLQHEFDAETTAYCERPRKLELRDGTIEVAFWTRRRGGNECLWLLIPTSESEPAIGGKRRYRREDQALEVAERAHLHLRFMFETELISKSTSQSIWFGLLPYVQTAHVLDNYVAIEARVREHFRFLKTSTFAQIEAALHELNPHDVRSAVCRAIHEGWLQIDLKHPLHMHTLVAQGVRYED